MVDLWQYIAPATEPGNLSGRPVGVTHHPGGDAIFQAQFDAPASRRVFHTKGVHGVPADWEELYVEGDYIMRAIDTSRPAKDGGPYTLHDSLSGRGSRWAKRQMAVGDVFERAPYISAFDMKSGVRTATGGPHRTWLKLARAHANWRGVADVIELWWLTESPTQTTTQERYFYGKGLGLVGFEGPGLKTYPNYVWEQRPPAAGVPVLTRKAIGFTLPSLPENSGIPNLPADGFWLLYPIEGEAWRNQGLGAARPYGPHEGVDYVATNQNATLYILAAHDGVVEEVDYDHDGLGWYVRILHEWQGKRYVSWYGHMAERPVVAFGDVVTAGQRIGVMGSTGYSTAKHLHFMLQGPGGVDGVYWLDGVLDPLPYIVTRIPAPPVTEPVTPPADTPPVWEWEFDTREQQQAFGDFLIRVGEGVKAAPGRRVYVRVTTEP